MNTNRMERYLLKSAGEDERGGGLGVVGNVAAAGIAGGAGYMGYQKFKPELHAAYHNIVGTAKSQATKGIMGYAKKGIAGIAALGAGAAIGGYHLLGGAEGVKATGRAIKKEVSGAYNARTAVVNKLTDKAKGPVAGVNFTNHYRDTIKPQTVKAKQFESTIAGDKHVHTDDFGKQYATHINENIKPHLATVEAFNKNNTIIKHDSIIDPAHSVQDQLQLHVNKYNDYITKHAPTPAKTASAFKPIHYRYY